MINVPAYRTGPLNRALAGSERVSLPEKIINNFWLRDVEELDAGRRCVEEERTVTGRRAKDTRRN